MLPSQTNNYRPYTKMHKAFCNIVPKTEYLALETETAIIFLPIREQGQVRHQIGKNNDN